MLERATASVSDSGEEAAFFKARAIYETTQLQQHKKHRRLIDFSLAVAIVILVVMVIVLYLSRN
jgi:type IV secretory pathway component VirB8